MNKLSLIVSLLFIAAFTVSAPLYAQTVSPATTLSPRQQRLQTAEENRITNLKQRADNEIDRRIASLNKINTRLSTIKRLTDAQKSSFSQQITAEITNLTTLKAKIDADTDLTTLKTDVTSIITSYRVYALFIPQIELVAAADRILSVADTLTALQAKLQARLTDAQGKGENVTTLQGDLTDMTSKITDAQTQANNAINSVLTLTPSGYPGNKSTLQTARGMLQTARQDLVAAFKDAKAIIQGLRGLRQTVTPATPSVTPIPTK